jgi:hypothetical protein
MPTVPSSDLIEVNNLAGNLPPSPARVGLVIGPTTLGTVNQILLDSSINAALQNFGTGPGTEEAATALNETNHGMVYQIKSAGSIAGSIGSVTKTNGAREGAVVDDFGSYLALGATFNGDVKLTAKVEGAQIVCVVAGSSGIATVGLVTTVTVTASTTGAQFVALITGDAPSLANWAAVAIGTGAAVCAQGFALFTETAGRIGIQALTSGMQYRMTISGTNTARSVTLTGGGTIVDVVGATNVNGEPTSIAIDVQSDLVALAAANPGKFRATLAGAGSALLGAKALTSLPFGSTGTMTVSGSPNDAYDISVQIRTPGGLGAADFRISLGKANGIPLYSGAIYAIPSGGSVVIPNTGLTLTFAGTFDADDLFSVATTAPLSSLSDILDSLDYYQLRPEAASLVAIAGKIPVVNLPAWIIALDTKARELEAAKHYLRILAEVEGPGPGQTNAQWAAQLTALTSALSSEFVSFYAGSNNGVSALPLPQNGRFEVVNGNRNMFARLLAFPPSRMPDDQSYGLGLTGVIQALETDVAEALAAARFSYAYTLTGVTGVNADGLLFDSNTGDYTYITYGRICDNVKFYGYLRQTRYLKARQRRNPDGTLDRGAKRAIEKDLTGFLNEKVVKPGDAVSVIPVVDGSNTDDALNIFYYIQIPFYANRINGRAGIVKTITATQVL